MENAVEALKIAFGYMMFVLALSISISCFSQAREAIDAIITIKDRETQYSYVEPSQKRVVGIETVIPTMYKAYKENFRVVFYRSYVDETNNTPLYLYKSFEPHENQATSAGKEINYIDLEQEIFADAQEAIEHLDIILNARPSRPDNYFTDTTSSRYYYQFLYEDGIYEEFKDYTFEEILGEYYQEDAKAGEETDAIAVNKTKKRVITYILQSP